MKTIAFAIISGLILGLRPQERVQDLKKGLSEINGRMMNSIYIQDKSQFEKTLNILNLAVLDYYNLKNQYNTDSRREEFKKTEDYKSKYSQLEALRSQLLSTTWCLDFEPDYQAERSIGLKYDPVAGCFSVSNDISLSIFFNDPGYIQLDQILFKCPAGMKTSKKNVNYACVDVIEETISFDIKDEARVSKIRENRNSLRLLFIFSFTGTVSTRGKELNMTSTDYSLTTSLQKIVAYNSGTDEIYATYE